MATGDVAVQEGIIQGHLQGSLVIYEGAVPGLAGARMSWV